MKKFVFKHDLNYTNIGKTMQLISVCIYYIYINHYIWNMLNKIENKMKLFQILNIFSHNEVYFIHLNMNI